MRQYTLWFAKIILLAAIIIVADYAVGKLDAFVYKIDNKIQPDYITKVSNRKDDILIIGSSTARHHYIPQQIQDSLGLTVYNAGLDGAFFVFQNCVVNYLLEKTPPKYILWEIGDDCLSDDKSKNQEYQSLNTLYPYYQNAYIHEVINSFDSWQKFRMLSKIYCDNSSMIHDVLTAFSVIRNGQPRRKVEEDKLNGYIPLPNDGYEYPEIKCDSTNEYVNPEKREMLINTIQECKRHGVQIVFTSSPRHYDADLLSLKQARELKRIAQEENIPYLNYYNFNDIANNNTYFKDCDHLNARGAEAYMEVFIPMLKQVIK